MNLFWILLSAWLVSACVTTNIYFPTPAVEKAADKIVADVWQQADNSVVPQPQTDKLQADKSVATKRVDKSVAAKRVDKPVVPKKEKK
jgi:hypothetical protein